MTYAHVHTTSVTIPTIVFLFTVKPETDCSTYLFYNANWSQTEWDWEIKAGIK